VRQVLVAVIATIVLIALAVIHDSGIHLAAAADGASATAGESAAADGDAASVYWTRDRLLDAQPWRQYASRLPDALPGAMPSATPEYLPADRVGALFERDATGNHYCTASVVSSPGQDLLITAAHCIDGGKGQGYQRNIVFIPGYAGGTAPFGVWTPRELIVPKQWADSSDPDYDVGFVVLKPLNGKNIQDVVGANQIGFGAGFTDLVQVTGYPSSSSAPVTCQNWTTEESATQLEFQCQGYSVGTSGSPWLTVPAARAGPDAQAGPGTIIGVIGGYQEGGDTNSVSYSVYFGPAIRTLYNQARSATAN
jgi:V8-like Glu-specific endopeptidase